ncbi:MAG: YkuS family protein [Solirubrobacterales bacterium]
MKIYVSPEFNNLKEQLKELGYEIIDEKITKCDAIICDLKKDGLRKINFQTNIKNEGTLIIDLGSKSLQDLDNILSNRVYSNIL